MVMRSGLPALKKDECQVVFREQMAQAAGHVEVVLGLVQAGWDTPAVQMHHAQVEKRIRVTLQADNVPRGASQELSRL